MNYYQRAAVPLKGSLIEGWGVSGADINTQLTEVSDRREWMPVPGLPPDLMMQGFAKLYLGGLLEPNSIHVSVPLHATVLEQFRTEVKNVPEWRVYFSGEDGE